MITRLTARLARARQQGYAPHVDFQRASATHRPLVAALWLVATLLIIQAWQQWDAILQISMRPAR